MRTRTALGCIAALAGLSIFSGCTPEISHQQLADKVGKPDDVQFFANRALYLGDKDGYRYVHVRDLFSCGTFLGEGTYKVPQSQWPMSHPMPLTSNAQLWQDVQWMGGEAPQDVPQSGFLALTPSFPEGAPAMPTPPGTQMSMPGTGPSSTQDAQQTQSASQTQSAPQTQNAPESQSAPQTQQ